MALHVAHLAVPIRSEPGKQMRFVLAEIGRADADLLETEFFTPALDAGGEFGMVDLLER